MNSSSSSSRALKCFLMNSVVSEDMIGLVGRGLVWQFLDAVEFLVEIWQHSVKTDNAAPGSFGLYRFIAARCINLLLQRPVDFGPCK